MSGGFSCRAPRPADATWPFGSRSAPRPAARHVDLGKPDPDTHGRDIRSRPGLGRYPLSQPRVAAIAIPGHDTADALDRLASRRPRVWLLAWPLLDLRAGGGPSRRDADA